MARDRQRGIGKDRGKVVTGKATVKPKGVPDTSGNIDKKAKQSVVEKYMEENGYTKKDVLKLVDMGEQWKLITWDAKKHFIDKES